MESKDIVGLLKIAAVCCDNNENSTYTRGKVSASDFDSITSELMVHVISSLMAHLDPTFLEGIHGTSRLEEFEQFQICNNMTYDSYPEEVFKAARKMFPPGDKRMELSLILFPQQDIKRAKAVITYLVEFVILSDHLHDTFYTEFENLNRENQEKLKLYDEIEEIKNEIAADVLNLQNKKEEKPLLEQELLDLEKDVLKEIRNLENLDDSCKSERKHYDDISLVNKRLETELVSLTEEGVSLKNLVVRSAPDLLQHLATEKQKLKDSRKMRDDLGGELNQLGYKITHFRELIARSKIAVRKFQELINTLHTAGESLNEIAKMNKDLEWKTKEYEEIMKSMRQVEAEHDRWELEYNKRVKNCNDDLSKYEQLVHQRHSVLEDLEYQYNEIMSQIEEAEQECRRTMSEGANAQMRRNELSVAVQGFPKQIEDLNRRIDQFMLVFKDLMSQRNKGVTSRRA